MNVNVIKISTMMKRNLHNDEEELKYVKLGYDMIEVIQEF